MRSKRSLDISLVLVGFFCLLLIGCSNTSALEKTELTSFNSSAETEKQILSEEPHASLLLVTPDPVEKTPVITLADEFSLSDNDLAAKSVPYDTSIQTKGTTEPIGSDNLDIVNTTLPVQYDSVSAANEVGQEKTIPEPLSIPSEVAYVAETQIAPTGLDISEEEILSQKATAPDSSEDKAHKDIFLAPLTVAQAIPTTSTVPSVLEGSTLDTKATNAVAPDVLDDFLLTAPMGKNLVLPALSQDSVSVQDTNPVLPAILSSGEYRNDADSINAEYEILPVEPLLQGSESSDDVPFSNMGSIQATPQNQASLQGVSFSPSTLLPQVSIPDSIDVADAQPQASELSLIPPLMAKGAGEYESRGIVARNVPSYKGVEAVPESKAEVESLLLFAKENEGQTNGDAEPLPSNQTPVSALQYSDNKQDETTLPVAYSGLADPSDTITKRLLVFIVVLIILVLMYLVTLWNKLKKRKIHLPSSKNPEQSRVRTMGQNGQDVQVTPIISPVFPVDFTGKFEIPPLSTPEDSRVHTINQSKADAQVSPLTSTEFSADFTSKLEIPSVYIPEESPGHTMIQNKADAQEILVISHIPPENSNSDPEVMYTVRIEEDVQSVRSYKIPVIPHQKADISGQIHWIQPGRQIELNGYCIDGGMLYIGAKARETTDPSYINTSKPVSSFDNYHVDLMGYWPSYSEISSDARGAYLAWLTHGKDDPNADPGYVFLFFYGLERRILIDYSDGKVGEEEIHQIRGEVERLLFTYRERSGAIKRYFTSFLNLLLVMELGNKKLYKEPIPVLYEGGDIPLYLKILLGQCANDAIPMSSEAAYLWVMHDPLVTKRTPVKRCTSEFKQLFLLRYSLHFGEGIRLPQNKTKVQASYHCASSHLYGTSLILQNVQNLPDVTCLLSLRKILQNLVDECSFNLDRHSRYIGKNEHVDNMKKSLAFLPSELVASIKEELIGEIQQLLSEKESIVIPILDVLHKILEEEKSTKEALHALAKILEIKNIGMEPDVLAYPYDVSSNDAILLFQLSKSIPKDRTEGNYLLNVMVLELAEAVARADGSVDEKESESIHQHIHSLQGISEYQTLRLHKHLEFLKNASVQESSIKKKLKAIPPSDVAKLLASVNHVVLADGVIDSSEIQFLERIYKYLNIDSTELYHHIQNPNEISRESTRDTDRSIDFARVASLKKESAEVSTLLSEIFSDDETKGNEDKAELSVPAEDEPKQHNPLGLDDLQMLFLTHLLSKSLWTREELQKLADEQKIMLDGTLELINENALNEYDLPVTEGDDEIEILEEFRGKTQWQ